MDESNPEVNNPEPISPIEKILAQIPEAIKKVTGDKLTPEQFEKVKVYLAINEVLSAGDTKFGRINLGKVAKYYNMPVDKLRELQKAALDIEGFEEIFDKVNSSLHHTLSHRQQQIHELRKEHFTIKEIAEKLNLQPQTVKNTITNINRKAA